MVSDENHIDPYDRLNGVFELQFHNLDVHNLPKCICNLSGGTENEWKGKISKKVKVTAAEYTRSKGSFPKNFEI